MERVHTKQRASTAGSVQRRLPSRQPSRARNATPTVSSNADRPDLLIQKAMDEIAVRNVFDLFAKFDKWDVTELLTARDTNWLLTNPDAYKVYIQFYLIFFSFSLFNHIKFLS